MNKLTKYTNAAGLTGIIIRSYDGTDALFRVYLNKAKTKFKDYQIIIDDLEVTISPDELCELVEDGEDLYLDHDRKTLGLTS